MSNKVSELRIIGDGQNIFDTEIEYTIPLYQRAYAWEEKQLTQLLEDIWDVSEESNYYIGSLIVSRQGNRYEVVDGQQRLTSLYLLLNCLNLPVKNTLTFACRDKSNYTLKNIADLLAEDRSKLDMDRIEESILNGIKILDKELKRPGFNQKTFLHKLAKVVVYRIEVPENTDLNRYFEIMNTRGEQLEQHDILKAALMSYLTSDSDKSIFARIWDACSDMTGYVQMHFVSSGNKMRENIFGASWGNLPSAEWKYYQNNIDGTAFEGNGFSIADITDYNFKYESGDGYLEDDIRVRFDSVIEFPFFLLHTLKVFISNYGIEHRNGKDSIIAELLDDKKLIDSFTQVIQYGKTAAGMIADNKEKFARDFIVCLLRTRYLFDKYIIKREYANENADGVWSLKSLFVSGLKTQKRPYYKNTTFAPKGGENSKDNDSKTNIMLQSALRVSYTSPKVMHWITRLLIWLSQDHCIHTSSNYIPYFSAVTENIIKTAVNENFINVCRGKAYAMGVNTPHIVFNYLDFLLWKTDSKKDSPQYTDFEFEFRNSVEHWYPQNPSEGTFEQWKDGVDQFGNLCIIQRNVNSKFSNMAPEAKKTTFEEMIDKGSLKLRVMSKLTVRHNNISASLYWKEVMYKQHENEMLDLLITACSQKGEIPVLIEDECRGLAGSNLDISKIVLEWALTKESIQVDKDKCDKTYVRYTTAAVSRILPETEEANSGWKTKTHYYFEIRNWDNKGISMQLALNTTNLSSSEREIYDRIVCLLPYGKKVTPNWEWHINYKTEKIPLYENTTKEKLISMLENLYNQIKDFENELLMKMHE